MDSQRRPHPGYPDSLLISNVITAPLAGWANVATRCPADATAYQLALEAQNLANGGFLVVASILGNQNYKPPDGPPPLGPGHIAVIMPANLSAADLTSEGPAEAQAGDVNSSMTHIKKGFKGHLPNPSVMDSIATGTSDETPMIQLFYNSKTLTLLFRG